jgi:hypothetical protein
LTEAASYELCEVFSGERSRLRAADLRELNVQVPGKDALLLHIHTADPS